MKFFLRSFFFIILGGLATLSFGFWQMMKNLPDPRFLEHYAPSSMTYIYDRNGRLMQEWGNEYRAFTSYSNIPNLLIQAFLSAEDKYFFQHPGVDFISLTRSLIHNLENKTVIGGSTITQQIAKNFVVGDEKTFLRKIKEAILAFKIEYYLSKSKILEIYLNHIYLGKKTFGVTAAAKKYFDKTLKELKPGDMAFLAALAKYPSAQNKTRVIQRRNWVLKRMNQDFLISEKMLKESLSDPFPLAKQKFKTDYGHYFLESVKRQVHYEKHQNIVTTLQPNLQKIIEKILSHHLSIYNKSAKTPLTGGVVIMDAKSGEVLAETGGYDYATQKFDCATQGKRQVGSLFKPFVYLTAFEKGVESSLTFYDQPLEFDGGYKPKNFSGRYYGNVSLEQAFIHSHNLITLQLAQYIGMPSIVKLVEKFNIFSNFKREWSSVLGSCETTLLNMVSAYSCMVNGGYKVEPTFIFSKDGMPFLTSKKEQIISHASSEKIKELMTRVAVDGTAKVLSVFQKIWKVGGKTGTTNESKEVWFVGFVQFPSGKIYTIGVFLGCLSPKSLGDKMTGGVLATPVFYNILREIYMQSPFIF